MKALGMNTIGLLDRMQTTYRIGVVGHHIVKKTFGQNAEKANGQQKRR